MHEASRTGRARELRGARRRDGLRVGARRLVEAARRAQADVDDGRGPPGLELEPQAAVRSHRDVTGRSPPPASAAETPSRTAPGVPVRSAVGRTAPRR